MPKQRRAKAARGQASTSQESIDLEEMKVGFEFTFMSGETREITEGKNLPSRTISYLERLVGEWESSLDESFVSTRVEQEKELGVGEADNWGEAPNLRVLKESMPGCELAADGVSGADQWWYRLSIDPSVIEVQTKPVAVKFLRDPSVENLDGTLRYPDGNVGLIEAFESIFDIAESCGLRPATQVGGGHINVDCVTSGVTRVCNGIRVVLAWEDSHKSQHSARLDQGTAMAQCHALIDVGRRHRNKGGTLEMSSTAAGRLKERLEELSRKPGTTMDDLRRLYDTFPQDALVYEPGRFAGATIDEQRRPNQDAERDYRTILHNQAVNLEHLMASGGAARLEFRMFDAQGSIEDIRNGIDLTQATIRYALGRTE